MRKSLSACSEVRSAAVRSDLSDVPLESALVASAEAAVSSVVHWLATMPSSLAARGQVSAGTEVVHCALESGGGSRRCCLERS